MIHRDIKPENMLLGRDQEILLTDFGIAVVAQSTRLQLTQETVGTISYMAPEQIQAHPRPASDQYSLGIVVYEWLSGSRPFAGTFTEVAAKHLMMPPPPLRGQAPTISPAVEEVIFTALAKDPKHRFGSVQAFANALKQASQTRQGVFPVPGQQPVANIQPIIPVAIMPTVFDVQPREPATVLNTPANPRMAQPPQPATVLNTPARPQGIALSPGGEGAIPTIVTRPDSPTELISSPPIQSQPKPVQQGISRRTVIVAGAAAAGVLAVGGITWFLLQHSSSTSPGQTTGGTTIMPTAPSTPTSAPTQPVASMLAQDTFHRPDQTFWGTASDGHRWGGEANVLVGFSIAGGMGQIYRIVNGHNYYTATLGPVITDADLVVSASLSRFNPSHLGVVLRFKDDVNYYKVLVDQMVRATDNTFQSGRGGLRPQLDQNDTLQISLFNMTKPTNA